MKLSYKKRRIIQGINYCECGKNIHLQAKRCKSCSNKNRAGTYNISKEAKEHMSKIHFTKIDPERAKKIYKKVSKANEGHIHSPKTRLKISESNKGKHTNNWNKGLTKETDERIKKISEKLTGRKNSEETKKVMSDAKKKEYANGRIHHMLGKKHTIETRRKLSENHHDISGSKNPNWKGGKSINL